MDKEKRDRGEREQGRGGKEGQGDGMRGRLREGKEQKGKVGERNRPGARGQRARYGGAWWD